VIVASTVATTEVLARVGVDVRVGVAVAAVTGVLVIVGVNVNAFATKDTCTGIAHWPCDVDVGPRHTTFAALSVGGFGTVDVAVAVSVKLALPVPEGVMRQSRTEAPAATPSVGTIAG
jgi:hypothetical protein